MKKFLLSTLLISISLPGFAQGNNGLVAHWKFNGNTADSGMYGYNAENYGAVPTKGYYGVDSTAYRFDGVHNMMIVRPPAGNDHLDLDTFSMCALVRIHGFYSGTCQGNFIIGRNGVVTERHYDLEFGDGYYDNYNCATYEPAHETFGGLAAWQDPNPASAWLSAGTVDTGVWYCLVSSYNGSTMKFYIDGVLVTSLPWPYQYVPGSVNEAIGIGFNYHDSAAYPYNLNGDIDDIRLYNRSLSVSEANQYCDTAKQNPLAVNNLPAKSENEIVIAPNPAHNDVQVQFDGLNTATIEVINSVGQIIYKNTSKQKNVDVDISSYPIGMYLMKIDVDGKTVTKKLLKQ